MQRNVNTGFKSPDTPEQITFPQGKSRFPTGTPTFTLSAPTHVWITTYLFIGILMLKYLNFTFLFSILIQ